MTPRPRVPLVTFAVLALTLVAAGCGSSGNGTGGGGAGGSANTGGSSNTGGAPSLAGACAASQGVGHFSLKMVAPVEGNAGFSQFGGYVEDKVSPGSIQLEKLVSGSCRMLANPTFSCSTACSTGNECVAMNQCGAAPVRHSVGTVTVSGLKAALSADPIGGTQKIYNASLNDFPPATVGAAITMSTAGGDYAPFTLHSLGIDPLTFAAPTAAIKDNQPYAFTWTPGTISSARVIAELNFTHHGGAPAIAQCDLPDTGAGEFPAAIVHALIENGTSGFPTISINRRVIDSTTAAPGCVDFAVSAFIERPVMIEGITSCNCNNPDCANMAEPLPCPAGHTCRPKGTPGGLTCD